MRESSRETVDAALAEFVQRRIRQKLLQLESLIEYDDDYDPKQARQKR